MGMPFMFWGGGDGSYDVNHGRGGGQVTGEAGVGGMAGAAGAGAMGGRGMSEEEQIYGGAGQQVSDLPRQPPSDGYPGPADGQYGDIRPRDDGTGMEGYQEDAGWIGEQQDEVMQDPWSQSGSDDSGWFGGGGGGDGGGSWGDWGS